MPRINEASARRWLRESLSTLCSTVVVALLATIGLAACGKSSEQMERDAARQVAMQKALADSLAEEHEKDRRMFDAATEQVNERMAREAAAHEREAARATAAGPTLEQQQAERAETLRRYTDKLMQTIKDPVSVQIRKMELSPKKNGMCAEFNAKMRTGSDAGFKRVGVTDTRVTPEEPAQGQTFTHVLFFQQ